MKKITSFLVITMFYSFSYAQKLNVDFFAGTSNYEGDLQSKFFTFKQSGVAAGVGLSYQLSNRIFIRSGFTFGKVGADDKKNPTVLSFRNLNFTSSIKELHAAAEYYLFNLDDVRFSPYVFGGVAVFHFNPYTYDTSGTKYFLQPLSTEGQGFYQNRKPYSLTQFAIPFGVGAKYALNNNIKIGLEIGMRKLFTDYLDDVSTTYIDQNLLLANKGPKALELAFRAAEISNTETYPVIFPKRGEPKNKDWYYFTGITLSFRLPGRGEIDDRWKPANGKSRLGCPSRVN